MQINVIISVVTTIPSVNHCFLVVDSYQNNVVVLLVREALQRRDGLVHIVRRIGLYAVGLSQFDLLWFKKFR